jgi:hypothetical protein
MYKISITLVLFYLGFSNAVLAQGELQMQKFYYNEVHRIAKKIYLMGLNHEITAYRNDSLASKVNAEDLKKIGASQVLKQVEKNGELVDSFYFQPFNPDSIRADIAANYGLIRKGDESIYTLQSISPLMEFKINGMLISIPFFCIKWNDLKRKLSSEEVELLQHYLFWSQFSPGGVNYKDLAQSLDVDWSNWTLTGRKFYTNRKTSATIGKAVYTQTIEALFRKFFNESAISLFNKSGQKVNLELFSKMHGQYIKTTLSPWWPDTTGMKDTTYFELPQKFDSLAIHFNKKELIWTVFCKNYSNQFQNETVEYYFKDADVRKILHPDLYFYCWYFAKNGTKTD